MLRITNLFVVTVLLIFLVFAALSLLIAAGVISVIPMDQYAYNGAWGIGCNWTAVVIDLINLIVMTIPLIRV